MRWQTFNACHAVDQYSVRIAFFLPQSSKIPLKLGENPNKCSAQSPSTWLETKGLLITMDNCWSVFVTHRSFTIRPGIRSSTLITILSIWSMLQWCQTAMFSAMLPTWCCKPRFLNSHVCQLEITTLRRKMIWTGWTTFKGDKKTREERKKKRSRALA